MMHASGRVIAQFVWQPFVEHPELATPEQMRALDKIQRVAEEVCIKLQPRPGDMQFINNFAVLHARAAWADGVDGARHFLRMGLRDPQNAWDLPARFAEKFTEGFAHPKAAQTIPVTDFDPYFSTTTNDMNHG